MTDIEAEARAYVEAYRSTQEARKYRNVEFDFMVGLVSALDARDAEIAKWKNLVAVQHEQHQEEIAQLTETAGRDHGHNEPCLMCGKPCSALAGNPSLWPLRLGNDGWHHAGCVNDALRAVKLGREATALAVRAAHREARAAAIEACCAAVCFGCWRGWERGLDNSYPALLMHKAEGCDVFGHQCNAAPIRALTAKPGSEP